MTSEQIHCGQLAYARFRKQSDGHLTPCVRPPHHSGNHVYGLTAFEVNAVQYYEEIHRGELKPVINVDLEPGTVFNEEEVAAVWQWMRRDI